MLVTERDFGIEKAAWQYWQLIRVLFFNFKIVGYLAVFFLGIACVSYLIGFISPFFQILCTAITSLALFIFVFVGVIILPMGILGLVTNRHIYTMADVRDKLFIVVCGFCLVFSIITFFILHDINRGEGWASFPFVIFLTSALYFWLAIYLMHKGMLLFGLAPLILGGAAKFCSNYFMDLHPLVVLVASVVAWVCFYRWWSGFRPVRAGMKSILFETDPKKLQSLPIEKWFYFSSNQVKTPMGSLLLGYGDGLLTLAKKLVVIYTTTFLFALFVCGGFKDGHFTENAFSAVLVTLAYSFLISGIDFFSQRMLMNLKRCWLHFPGNRIEFFVYLERTFQRGLGFLGLLNLSVICVFLWGTHHANYFLYCLTGLVIFSLVLVWNLYLSIYFYSRNGFVLGEINFQKLIVNLILFIPPIVYLVYKYQRADYFEVWDAVAMVFVLLLTTGLNLIRSQTIKYWQQANF